MYISDVYFEWKAWISQAWLSSELSSQCTAPYPPLSWFPLSQNGRGFLVQLDLKAEVLDVLLLNDEEKPITLYFLHPREGGRRSDEGPVGTIKTAMSLS